MQQCALCRRRAKLRESHLLPASLYRIIRSDSGSTSLRHPVLVHNGKAVMTSIQFTCPLLCDNCEDLFSKKGERIVVAECHRPHESFLLRSKLETEKISFRDRKGAPWFSGSSLRSVDVEAYRYFAVSVFWRGSVGHWKPREPLACRYSLGERYEEDFRLYLLEEATLPKQALLIVFVDSGEEPLALISSPESCNKGGYYLHHFRIPGIGFSLYLGRHIEHSLRYLADQFGTNIFFVLTDFRADPSFKEILQVIKGAELKGKLALGA